MALLGRTRIFFGEIKTHSSYRKSTYEFGTKGAANFGEFDETTTRGDDIRFQPKGREAHLRQQQGLLLRPPTRPEIDLLCLFCVAEG